MPMKLKNLRLDEVSLVDRGANQHAHVTLFKRDFSDDKRKELAASGKALPDGSFPIETEADLENAVHAFGRAKDKAKAKAHIIARAKSLGCEDKLPDGWDVSKGIASHIAASATALFKSTMSIFQDKDAVNKQALLTESFEQFQDHLQGAAAEEMSKAVEAASTTMEKTMTEAEKKAAEDKAEREKKDKEHEDTKKALAVAKRENAILKMSAKHKDYMDSAEMDEDEKDKFAAKSPEERDEHMSKHPIEKRLPESVRKALAQADDDRKVLKSLQEKDEVATFAKRAAELGLPESQGEVLRKAYAGDAEGIKKLEQVIKGLNEQIRTGKVFEEFGKQGGGKEGITAYDQLMAKAGEYRDSMVKLGKRCSEQQAFSKVYTDPANAELKKQHDADEVNKRARVAA